MKSKLIPALQVQNILYVFLKCLNQVSTELMYQLQISEFQIVQNSVQLCSITYVAVHVRFLHNLIIVFFPGKDFFFWLKIFFSYFQN